MNNNYESIYTTQNLTGISRRASEYFYNTKIGQNPELKSKIQEAENQDEYIKQPEVPQKKVGLLEGAGLFFKGVKDRFVKTIKEIKDHPFRSALITAGMLSVLPLLAVIGVPLGVSSACLAAFFAGMAGFRLVKDGINIAKYNQSREYDKAREAIGNLGGDSLDFAMVAPFIPKGFNQLKYLRVNSASVNKIYNARNIALSNSKGLTDKLEIILKSEAEIATNASKEYPGFFRKTILKPFSGYITKNAPKIGELYRSITNSVFGSLMTVNSSSSMIGRKTKELGLTSLDRLDEIMKGEADI